MNKHIGPENFNYNYNIFNSIIRIETIASAQWKYHQKQNQSNKYTHYNLETIESLSGFSIYTFGRAHSGHYYWWYFCVRIAIAIFILAIRKWFMWNGNTVASDSNSNNVHRKSNVERAKSDSLLFFLSLIQNFESRRNNTAIHLRIPFQPKHDWPCRL